MPYVPAALKRAVIDRARNRCEYCLLHLDDVEFPHEIDHLVPVIHGGETVIDNLSLACLKCNRRKGTNLVAIDPVDRGVVLLFNPRQQVWREHFKIVGAYLIGLTATGRATTALLMLNDETRIERRLALIDAGRYPPEGTESA